MYRTDVDIVTQILEITANGGSNTTKSKIMDGASKPCTAKELSYNID